MVSAQSMSLLIECGMNSAMIIKDAERECDSWDYGFGVGNTAQPIECSLCKHGDLTWIGNTYIYIYIKIWHRGRSWGGWGRRIPGWPIYWSQSSWLSGRLSQKMVWTAIEKDMQHCFLDSIWYTYMNISTQNLEKEEGIWCEIQLLIHSLQHLGTNCVTWGNSA